MSIHIGAEKGDIAEIVLLPGDPLRAKWIAETFLKDVFCYSTVRGMHGYTGTFNGKRVSVQGTGMGMPSISIYTHELITEYGVKKLIRVGSAGSYQIDVQLRDIVIAMSASTNSNMNNEIFQGETFAPTASFALLSQAVTQAQKQDIAVTVGPILSSDAFYRDNSEYYKKWASHGILCVEMETAALYTIAAKYGVEALGILTISDSLVTHEATTSQEREQTFTAMIQIALELV